jgi:hypothetical protein
LPDFPSLSSWATRFDFHSCQADESSVELVKSSEINGFARQ